jgi:hypothetical protein
MPPGFEVGGISHGGDQRGRCDDADARIVIIRRHASTLRATITNSCSISASLALISRSCSTKRRKLRRRIGGHACVGFIFNHCRQQAYVVRAVWSDYSELGEMAPMALMSCVRCRISSSRTR